jgi:hypothetical protein
MVAEDNGLWCWMRHGIGTQQKERLEDSTSLIEVL